MGLRTQVIAATGTGKTLIAAHAAERLRARRALVLVPTLDLLVQTAAAWREAGRSGAMLGVCSLRAEESQGIPCTTNPGELADWVGGLERVTVFATYAAVGMGILQRAHEAGLGVWDLMIIDEAHRTSGDAGRPWAAVHDQAKIPADRRLYMTATARVWEAEEGSAAEGRLVASMEPDSPVFGPVVFKLTLSEAISRGLIAPYQVVCVDIADTELHALAKAGPGSDTARGARLAALQTSILTAAAQERFRKVLTFHGRVGDAEAMAEGLPEVVRRLHASDKHRFPAPNRVTADWLYGEHPPAHRQAVLAEFAEDVIEDQEGMRTAALRVLSSVRVLGEGVDTANCDSVAFCDARGSMIDIVQMVGRALRMRPGQGKIASLIVPVFLGPGETPDEMLTSQGYGTLAKVLSALRSHDAETIETLADPRHRSGNYTPDDVDGQEGEETEPADREPGEEADGQEQGLGVSGPARQLLRFSAPRDPAVLARFMRLRVIEPEKAYWRAGIEAAARYLKETGAQELRVPQTFLTPEEWAPAGFPLGRWVANQRRFHKAGHLDADRVAELDALGMVWSAQDVAFEEGLAAARAWAAAHGHLLPPATAVWEDYPVGTWVKAQRAAAKVADRNAELREAGEHGQSSGALTEARRESLEEIDPGWCPGWDISWQRCFRLTQQHIRAGGRLPSGAGEVVVQGEDLGRWVTAVRCGWDELLPAQRWLAENVLGLEPAAPGERPVKRTQDDKWATNLRAARQFHAREGHLRAPRKHEEHLAPEEGVNGAQGGAESLVKLGMWISNVRKRADKLTAQRRAELDGLDMQW